MSRPRTPIGTFGEIGFSTAASERSAPAPGCATTTGGSDACRRPARRHGRRACPQVKITRRGTYTSREGELAPDSPSQHRSRSGSPTWTWKASLPPSTRALYERNMRQLVMPAFEHYTLREITIGRVDRFLKSLANKSYSRAKQAKTVLDLALGLAVHYEAMKHNPVRESEADEESCRLKRVMALTHRDQLEAIRPAARAWRRGTGALRAGPDGQLEQIIEVMLGTSARIGEVLAIRKCDIHITRFAGNSDALRHHRVAQGKADPPPRRTRRRRSRQRTGFGADASRRRCCASALLVVGGGGARASALLQPQPHPSDDEQRPTASAHDPGGGRHHGVTPALVPSDGRHGDGPAGGADLAVQQSGRQDGGGVEGPL